VVGKTKAQNVAYTEVTDFEIRVNIKLDLPEEYRAYRESDHKKYGG
jgi:hypothetical protein